LFVNIYDSTLAVRENLPFNTSKRTKTNNSKHNTYERSSTPAAHRASKLNLRVSRNQKRAKNFKKGILFGLEEIWEVI